MTTVPDFFSMKETNKPVEDRVFHNNGACPPGRDIKAAKEDRPGKHLYRLCKDCIQRNRDGK